MEFQNIYRKLRYPGKTLSQKVFHGSFWVFSLRIIDRLFKLARTVILARLLTPNDFGLFGIAVLALATIQSFSRTGFNAALIQKKEDTEPYLDSAWTIQIIRGTIIALIMVAGAPLVGNFFEEPRAIMLTRVLAISVFIFGFRNIGIVYFRKELEFHKQFAYRFSGTIADLAIAIPTAFILKSVWALIFGLLARNVVLVIVSYRVHLYRPFFKFSLQKSKELFKFGKWMLGISFFSFIATQGDDVFLGKVLGITSLGLYQMAYRISNLAHTEIAGTISKVLFPAYSKLQENTLKLRFIFSKTLELAYFLFMPLTVMIILLGSEFTILFLGKNWMSMVVAMKIMAVAGFIRAVGKIHGQLFKSGGYPKINFWIITVWVGVMAIVIYPLSTTLGLTGTSIAVLLGTVATIPIWWVNLKRFIPNVKHLHLNSLFYPIFGTIIMIGCILIVKYFQTEITIINFLISLLIGGLIYISFNTIILLKFDRGPFKIIREIIRNG